MPECGTKRIPHGTESYIYNFLLLILIPTAHHYLQQILLHNFDHRLNIFSDVD